LKKIELAHDEAKMKAAKKDKNGKSKLFIYVASSSVVG
jgi:hypothetical protein